MLPKAAKCRQAAMAMMATDLLYEEGEGRVLARGFD